MITEYTKKLIDLALNIARAALENQKEYFIGGGLAIDFSAGQITRNHHYQRKYIDSERHWGETKVVNYEGVDIRIENPDRVLDQKLRHIKKGEKIRLQDLHDFNVGKKTALM